MLQSLQAWARAHVAETGHQVELTLGYDLRPLGWEIRRIANRLARQQIEPADVIAWSLWRRAHQAAAQRAHVQMQLQL